MTYSVKLVIADGAPRNSASVLLGYLRREDKSERHMLEGAEFSTLDAGSMARFANDVTNEANPARLSTASSGPTSFSPPLGGDEDDTDEAEVATLKAGKPIVVLVDVGIAYWHSRFCGNDTAAFNKVRFLTASGKTKDGPDAKDLNAHFKRHGNAHVLKRLGKTFKNSIYASERISEPAIRDGDFAHGTAMADFILKGIEPEKWPNLIGYELPKSIFLDRSGATVREFLTQCVVPKALKERGDSKTPIHIVVPYAFLGGPHSEEGPEVVRLLKDLVKDEAAILYFPTGNHLQDALHIRLPDAEKGTFSKAATWRLPANDSTNATFEVWWQGPEAISLHLTDPYGASLDPDEAWTQDSLTEDALSFVFVGDASAQADNDAIIGVQRVEDGDWHGLVVCIAPTDPPADSSTTAAPAGDWTLCLSSSKGTLKNIAGWVRRDDPIQVSGLKLDAQQSWLVDPDYVITDPNEQKPLGAGETSLVRRWGTASMLTVGQDWDKRVIAGASETALEGEVADDTAPYTGRRMDGSYGEKIAIGTRGRGGLVALYNGSGMEDRLSGTSVAIAKCVNALLKS
jgi:hypothetical protein